jgi:hypothetical protein
MFLACQKSIVTIQLKFYYSNLKNAVETAKIAVDSCYVLRQFLTPLPSIDFREIRGLHGVEFNQATFVFIFPVNLIMVYTVVANLKAFAPLATTRSSFVK